MPAVPASPSLLLLIPAYNEERRLPPVLEAYLDHFKNHWPGPFRLVVILNGCRDNTAGVVQLAEQRHPSLAHLEFTGAIGKGGALIEGLKLAPTSDLVGYVDADGATPPEAFFDLATRAAKGEADCVIASRWIPGARVDVAQAKDRRRASRLFHHAVEALFWMGIKDTQCGAKVMRREAVERIQPFLQLADLAFDVNLLYSLKRAGFTIAEVPTIWTDKSGSKVAFNVQTSLNMLLSLFRLRILYSPLKGLLKPLAPLILLAYRKLNAPPPRTDDEARQNQPAELHHG